MAAARLPVAAPQSWARWSPPPPDPVSRHPLGAPEAVTPSLFFSSRRLHPQESLGRASVSGHQRSRTASGPQPVNTRDAERYQGGKEEVTVFPQSHSKRPVITKIPHSTMSRPAARNARRRFAIDPPMEPRLSVSGSRLHRFPYLNPRSQLRNPRFAAI